MSAILAFRPVEKALWSLNNVGLDESRVHVWGILLEAEADTLEKCLRCLSPEESMRANRFMSERQRRHFIVTHGALRMVLSRYSGREPEKLSFQNTPSGKPMLQGAHESAGSIRFNLSHSHGRALIAVSKDREVGVDLEKIRVERDVTALAARFFAPQEQAVIACAGPTGRHRTFSRIWVAKEAVLKSQGSGLTFPLDRHRIELSRDGTTCRLVGESSQPGKVPPSIQFLPLEEGWVGAVASEGKRWSVTLRT